MFSLCIVFLVGACFGSFANLIIYRLPRKLSVVRPGSHCVSCKNKITWFHNIPILSVIFLKARCFSCKKFFGWETLFVEAGMAMLFVAIFISYGTSITAFEFYVFVFGLMIVSFIDLEFRIIPDVFSLTGIVLGLIGAYLNPDRSFTSAVFGMFLGGGIFWLMAWFYWVLRKQEGMGGGDIKLIAWIGAVLGWQSITFVILFSSISGSIVGLYTAWRSKEGMQAAIPFGPFLALAAIIYMFGGHSLGQYYMQLLFPR